MNNGRKRNGLIGLIIMAVLAAGVIYGSTPLYNALENIGGGNEPLVLKDGTYTARDEAPGESGFEKGYTNEVTLVVEDGKITSVTWDSVHTSGSGKIQESLDGDYVMKAGGKTWAEQSELLGAYVVEQQTTKGLLNSGDDGKTDAVSGVSIDISGFIRVVEKAIEQAAEE